LFELRKELEISDGKMDFVDIENNDSYIYTNKVKDATLLVIANFRNKVIDVSLDIELNGYQYLMGNTKERKLEKELTLSEYETLIYIKK
jgi:hypothetical protein